MQMIIVGTREIIQTIAIVSSAHTSTNVVATKVMKMNNDLISRERLKNTILLGNYDTQSKILSAIDNAPTVIESDK